jgi:hypothetical protein
VELHGWRWLADGGTQLYTLRQQRQRPPLSPDH